LRGKWSYTFASLEKCARMERQQSFLLMADGPV
jgi:hypothetical protein